MRIIGAIFIFGLSCLIGSSNGVLGFLEAWAIIGIFAMIGSISCIFLGLPHLAYRGHRLETNPEEIDVETMTYRHMSAWGWSGFFMLGLIGAIVANVIV
jgi:hypothetical protein